MAGPFGALNMGPRLHRGYRLRFFEETIEDLPWLSLQQTLMLVIRGTQAAWESKQGRV